MAKLYMNNEASQKKETAPGKTGASSVSGSKNKKSNSEVDLVEQEVKKIKADVEVNFYLPFAPSGESFVSVPHPVMDKDGMLTGETEDKKVKLTNKFFTAKKKDMKNAAYWAEFKKLMMHAGFELYSSLKNEEDLKKYREQLAKKPVKKSVEKRTQKVFGAFRPEHLDSDMVFTMAFQVGDQVRKFEEVKGTLYTKEPELHKIFLKNGYTDIGFVDNKVKPSKEIKKAEKKDSEDKE